MLLSFQLRGFSSEEKKGTRVFLAKMTLTPLGQHSHKYAYYFGIKVKHIFTYGSAIEKRLRKYSRGATTNRHFGFTYIHTWYVISGICVAKIHVFQP